MFSKTWGFIGGGRVTRIFLEGFKRSGNFPAKVIVSDCNTDVLENLKMSFPSIEIHHNDNKQPAKADLVFLALHPPVIGEFLKEIQNELNSKSVLISLAPKFTIAKLSEALNGFNRIVRMNPNAPSIINKGYNPVAFANSFSEKEKDSLLNLFKLLGECPVVDESKIEAYAIITAMGATYFWFQLQELKSLGESFGLESDEVECGIKYMINGAVNTLFGSGLSTEEVLNLIPVKPIAENEEQIKEIYRSKLIPIYNKIKP